MDGGRVYTPGPHRTPSLDLPLAMNYRSHQKSLAYFSYLAPLVFSFLLKGRVKRGGGGHGTMLSLNTVRSYIDANIVLMLNVY